MPHSYTYFKTDVKQFIENKIPRTSKILDVGPGVGTYAKLLPEYKMDCVEIHKPYIEQFNLHQLYNKVINDNIINIDLAEYDFVILGDVLEHLSVRNAQKLIYNIVNSGKECLVAVPYMMEQGEWGGNIHETHLQPDLTIEVMKQRYPSLKLIYGNEKYGYYFGTKKSPRKAYVVYTNEAYIDLAKLCVESINKHSDYPVYAYVLDSDTKVKGAVNIRWEFESQNIKNRLSYIDRENPEIYRLLIERPAIIKHALQYNDIVCYVDCDSIATKFVDTIFDYFDEYSNYPYFVEGIYDFLHYNGRGGADSFDDLTTTLEHPVCELFHSNQLERKFTKYRQTGYFVAGQNCVDFLDLWYYRCNHPTILKNNALYAPYNEETVLQTLIYDYKAYKGLPYIYMNGYRKPEFRGEAYQLESWVRIPATESQLLFYHGEKNIEKIKKIIDENIISSPSP